MAESQQPLHMLLATSSHPTCPQAELPPSPGAALSPRLPRYPGARQRTPAGPAQHLVTDTTQPKPHVPGGSARASRSSSSSAAALPLLLPSAARRLLRKNCCQEMRHWIRWIPAVGIPTSPTSRCQRGLVWQPPWAAPVQPAHRQLVSAAALAGLAGAGGSECHPGQSVQTHTSNTWREMEMEVTCCRAGAMPRAHHPP